MLSTSGVAPRAWGMDSKSFAAFHAGGSSSVGMSLPAPRIKMNCVCVGTRCLLYPADGQSEAAGTRRAPVPSRDGRRRSGGGINQVEYACGVVSSSRRKTDADGAGLRLVLARVRSVLRKSVQTDTGQRKNVVRGRGECIGPGPDVSSTGGARDVRASL